MNPWWRKKLTVVSVAVPCLLLGASLLAFSGIAQEPQSAPAPNSATQSEQIAGFDSARAAAEAELEQKFLAIPSAAHAESNLRHLTSTPHLAGTEASHRVAEWLRDRYRSFGFDAKIVSYSVWLPMPREIKLEMVKPKREELATPEPPVPGDTDTYNRHATPGYNTYSPSGDVTAPVVYVNYGMVRDYRELDHLGISVKGRIVLARYGRGYRGIKAKLAEEHHAAGLILYSDPQDDGYAAGDTFPHGPWRPMGGIQRGSILYTQIYPGDPLTPGVASVPGAKRISPNDAASLPHIPTMPISAQDASVILRAMGGRHVPRTWQGALPFTYHIGAGHVRMHLKLVMDYRERPLYDVIAKFHGSLDDQWVILGNHHDAWVYGAADPNSGTASLLETARALGELVRSGWKPRRTIVICNWDGEEPGLLGSTEWVEQHRAELQSKAIAYINTDVGVTGPNFTASASPSLNDLIRAATRQVPDPDTGQTVYDAWSEHSAGGRAELSGVARQASGARSSGEAAVGALGSGSDYSPFFDFAGIPAIDLAFSGDYGVYHSLYDDFYWMKHFGDPTFAYHVALARVLGILALRLDEAGVVPFDYSIYSSEISRSAEDLASRVSRDSDESAALQPVLDAAALLSESSSREAMAIGALAGAPIDPALDNRLSLGLADVEQSFLDPEGLIGRPWYKHTIFAPGSYAGYSAEMLPGITEAIENHDLPTLRIEADAVAQALLRASEHLDQIAHLAQDSQTPTPQPFSGRE
ncbi:MAG: M28 family metallopeptidase [Candidatus Acidiferrales bacterium]